MRGEVRSRSVAGHLEAVVTLRVRGPAGDEMEVTGVLDTGFDDDLALPFEFIAQLGLPFRETVDVMMADGRITPVSIFRGEVVGEDEPPRPVSVQVVIGEPLVGMSLLRGKRVTLDVIPGGPVSVEVLP